MAINFPATPQVNDTYTVNNTTWQYDGTSWNVVTASSSVVIPTIPNVFSNVAVLGQNNIVAESTTDTLNVVAGNNITITTDADTDSLTIAASGGAGGEVNQNAFSTVAVSGQTDVTADSATDTLTLAAGSNVTLVTSGNTVTIASTASGGASDFNTLNDAFTASLAIDKIYEPAIVMLRVDNAGATSYTFNSHYSGNNPTIYAISGTTIAFDLNAISGHPFEIQDATLSALTTNLVHVAPDGTVSTGSNAQGKTSGTLYWRIPETSSGTFAYQCQIHAAMVGNIIVKRLSQI